MNTDFTDIKFIDSKNYHIFSVDTYQKKSPADCFPRLPPQ